MLVPPTRNSRNGRDQHRRLFAGGVAGAAPRERQPTGVASWVCSYGFSHRIGASLQRDIEQAVLRLEELGKDQPKIEDKFRFCDAHRNLCICVDEGWLS